MVLLSIRSCFAAAAPYKVASDATAGPQRRFFQCSSYHQSSNYNTFSRTILLGAAHQKNMRNSDATEEQVKWMIKLTAHRKLRKTTSETHWYARF